MSVRATTEVLPIQAVTASAYTLPTDGPESDGTIAWDSTTLVVAEVQAGGRWGLGYTYADASAAELIRRQLAPAVQGQHALDLPACWGAMVASVRNIGRPGIASYAISAVDNALWDLKGKLLGVPVSALLGHVRPAVAIYGSGGFTSYDVVRLRLQLAGWVQEGIQRVKMKVGRHPYEDVSRVRAARQAIGEQAALMVDANGAYTRKEALTFAEAIAPYDVSWFEEPVSSDDLEGLRLLRDRAPAPLDIAAGEYGCDPVYFRRMLEAGAVDVLQADATRCCGLTGFIKAAALAEAHMVPLSAHTAPSLHVHAGVALAPVVHLEYFYDHVRIERMLFDGAPWPQAGQLAPDRSRPGLGLELKRADAARYAV
jgi:L-alanine-DL-glutamate epimerase-like enolase superfamily enzyme